MLALVPSPGLATIMRVLPEIAPGISKPLLRLPHRQTSLLQIRDGITIQALTTQIIPTILLGTAILCIATGWPLTCPPLRRLLLQQNYKSKPTIIPALIPAKPTS